MVKYLMNEIERTAAAADGPVVSEGGRSPSTLSPGQRDASQGGTPPAATPTWPAGAGAALERGAQARGGAAAAAGRGGGATLARVGRADLPAGAVACQRRGGTRRRAQGPCGRACQPRACRRHAAHRRAVDGERAAALAHRAPRPFGPAEVALMADATSPATRQRYAIVRVCRSCKQPRSSFYAARQTRAGGDTPAAPPQPRGPKPAISDGAL